MWLKSIKNIHMKKLFIIISLITITFCAHAQRMAMGSTYKTAIGVKFYPGAISIKSFALLLFCIEK